MLHTSAFPVQPDRCSEQDDMGALTIRLMPDGAANIRSVRSPSGRLVAQRDDRWSGPSRDTRRYDRPRPSDDRFGCVPNWPLWRGVPRALGQVLACLAHRHTRPAGRAADHQSQPAALLGAAATPPLASSRCSRSPGRAGHRGGQPRGSTS
jgi:hypothetical protein